MLNHVDHQVDPVPLVWETWNDFNIPAPFWYNYLRCGSLQQSWSPWSHKLIKASLLWFSLHIVLCRLSGVGVVHVSPCSWLLRTSGSLALGKFLKRTSHLFCTLCTPPQAPASHWPSHGNLWNLPQAIRVNTSLSENSGSFKHGQKWKLPMNNDLQWWSIMLTFWTFIRVKNTIRTILLNFYLR